MRRIHYGHGLYVDWTDDEYRRLQEVKDARREEARSTQSFNARIHNAQRRHLHGSGINPLPPIETSWDKLINRVWKMTHIDGLRIMKDT